MNSTTTPQPVKSIASELTTLLRCSRPSQSLFWVAVLHGAVTPEGWLGDAAEKRSQFEATTGKKWHAGRVRRAMRELESCGMIEATWTAGHPTSARIPFSSSILLLLTEERRLKNIYPFSLSKVTDHNDIAGIDESPTVASRPQVRDSKDLQTELVHENQHKVERRENNQPTQVERTDSVITMRDSRGLAAKLVEFWAKRSGRDRVKILERRVRMVRSRLREQYEPDDLFRAVAGVCYSPFHQENGFDTFEVALRNGEQVEKGVHLWFLHAPAQHIAAHEERTGEVIKTRTDDVARLRQATMQRSEFDEKVAVLQRDREQENQARQEEEQRDADVTAMALDGLTIEEEDQDEC